MTAQVWPGDGRPVQGSTEWECRNRFRRQPQRDRLRETLGQLWQREAERDVRKHGEPRPSGRVAVSFFTPSRDLARAHVDEGIEHRRPEMRARALRMLRPDGVPTYRVSLDGSGRLERTPPLDFGA